MTMGRRGQRRRKGFEVEHLCPVNPDSPPSDRQPERRTGPVLALRHGQIRSGCAGRDGSWFGVAYGLWRDKNGSRRGRVRCWLLRLHRSAGLRERRMLRRAERPRPDSGGAHILRRKRASLPLFLHGTDGKDDRLRYRRRLHDRGSRRRTATVSGLCPIQPRPLQSQGLHANGERLKRNL
jgi:hypothetical protein